jgi:hypothetical protein
MNHRYSWSRFVRFWWCSGEKPLRVKLVAILIPLVLFLYSVSHVTALRNLVILGLTLNAAWVITSVGPRQWRREISVSLVLLGALQLWLVSVSLGLSPTPAASLREWMGEWLRASAIFLVGILSGLLLVGERHSPKRLAPLVSALIVLPTAAHAFVHCLLAVKHYSPEVFKTEYFGMSDHRANITYIVSLGLPFVLMDIYERFCRKQRLLSVPHWCSATILIIYLAAIATSGTRNGIITVALVLGGWSVFLALGVPAGARKRATLVAVCLLSFGLVILLGLSVSTDDRWGRLLDTVKVASNYKNQTAWYSFPDEPLPRTTSGGTIDESAYLRTVFALEGTRLLMEHPFGTGIGRHAFKHLVAAKHENADVSHTHIGLLDLGLYAGFPGVGVWLLFIAWIGYVGWKGANNRVNPLGNALLMLVAVFALRMSIDSTLRDHILEQFMLVAGLMVVTCLAENGEDEKSHY